MVFATLKFDLDNPKDSIRHNKVLEYLNGTGAMQGPPIDKKENSDKVHVFGKVEAVGKKKDVIKVGNKWYHVDNRDNYPEGKNIDEYLKESVYKKQYENN